MADDRAKVVSTDPSRARVLYEGLVADAKQFVERNFPRPHVEPPGHPSDVPTPDVKLVTADGEQTYHADTGWSGDAKPEAEAAEAASEEEGTELA